MSQSNWSQVECQPEKKKINTKITGEAQVSVSLIKNVLQKSIKILYFGWRKNSYIHSH